MVGRRIKNLRIKKGYSINELSEKAEVSKSYLSYIERGIQKNPSLQVLSRIAKTLDANLEDLLEENKDMIADLTSLDEEWVNLVREAIRQGITKEDFTYYLEFIKFKKMNEGKG
ncbi:helix-turn-helix domain-containing protein [Bacillus sp. ISL-47]|uniref:helix-turn-helix domain-containing protein n=1 Tax=Bacillus sp. ISL-47 TaxID=2819130 RepID=UPI001BE9DAD6|nr:helix-turn-helix domain-containing protein [Bacillus sp. ISL-47]MBT2688464.1 helix-turn-helix domain-containing protein [Bacillus sp. ISL-47]MBT2709073.1 helix-turn-helix domain-containing protein [Pseudomonas sp. ISL-84]